MYHEIPVPFRRDIRGVVLDDVLPAAAPADDAPPPPPSQREQELEDEVRRLAGLLAQFEEFAAGIRKEQDQRLEEMRRAAVELAVAVAAHLVQEQIDRGAFAVEELVRKVVEQIESPAAVTVHLHPDDLALLESRLGADQPLLAGGGAVEIIADRTLARGNCRATTGDVQVLWRLKDQFEAIRSHLLQALPAPRREAPAA